VIPDELIDQIRESADIVAVIGEYVSLKRLGADYRGPCPFHQGTHRNFSVSPRKRMYYCFVCHEGGDVFNFLQKRLGVDWPSAVRMVADKAGIEVRESDTRREGPDSREPFWEVNAVAADYFRRILWEDEMGAAARDYLAKRHVSRELAERFGLGFAPREIGLMRAYMQSLGFDDARMLQAGLLVQAEEAAEPRPRFRNRLIFPILDASGRHVGFGGRLLGPGEPKYLNSAESPVYSKGRLLYGLNWAKLAIRRDERLLLVEGYFDAMRVAGAGIEAVVAPLGTALTDDQASLIRRYARNVFLLYDSDKAGLKATFRAGDVLLRHDVAVQVVTLPEGEDPDSFVDKQGAQGLEAQIASAIDVFERKVQLLERAGWFADLRRKRRAIDRLLPTMRATADPVTRDLYLARASEASGVSREILLRELAHAGRGTAASTSSGARSSDADADTPSRTQLSVRLGERRAGDRRRSRGDAGADPGRVFPLSTERELVRVMLHVRSQVDILSERVGPDSFREPAYRDIYRALLDLGPDATVEQLAATLEPGSVEVLHQLLGQGEGVIRPEKTIAYGLAVLRVREVQQRLRRIDAELQIADDAEKDQLTSEKTQLMREVRALGGLGYRTFGKSRS
jgi:DNA primase